MAGLVWYPYSSRTLSYCPSHHCRAFWNILSHGEALSDC